MTDSGPAAVVVEGPVESGVEHGSVVLRDADGGQWQLGKGSAHLVGCRVRVTGRIRTGMMGTAQQGTLLGVDEVEVLEGTPRPRGSRGAV
jgi:hypothetical protein